MSGGFELQQCFGSLGATSMPGLRRKNPLGLSWKPVCSTGITGQSSVRGMWFVPNVYQSTTSSFSRGRSAAVQRGRPSRPSCWYGWSPAG